MSENRNQRGGRRRYFSRPRECQFCSDPSIKIYYRDTQLLSGFINREGKIRPRRQTGTCAKHQRKVAVAVKRARHMALIQFAGESLN
jgi:small subunit ribosomal protein S18